MIDDDTIRHAKAQAILTARARLVRIKHNMLAHYRPYERQQQFHELKCRERALIAGNQVGKTWCAGMEMAMHLTGEYPDGWQGRRYNGPIVAIVGSKSGQLLRDGAQRVLFGRAGELGTGAIPKHALPERPRKSPGTPDLLDSSLVRHVNGGASTIILKTYDQGRERWQADTVNEVWMDEEPPLDVYSEALTRTAATDGRVTLTLTPLLGMSTVVRRFLFEQSPNRAYISMTIDDAPHFTATQRADIIAGYPAHEREARARGTPIMGSGRVFPVADSEIAWAPTAIPDAWTRIIGLDFGWDHPTAAAWLAWDRDADVIYVTDCYRASQESVLVHAGTIRQRGNYVVAWPHDGLQHDKGSGEQLAALYRTHGLQMLPERATFEDGTNGVEAGIAEMLDRMQTGRFKVAEHLSEWFEEFRLYHRANGRIVKERDDIISATRYGMMMRRFARSGSAKHKDLGLSNYGVAYA